MDGVASLGELNHATLALNAFEAANVRVDRPIRQHMLFQIIDSVRYLFNGCSATIEFLLKAQHIVVLLLFSVEHLLVVGVHVLGLSLLKAGLLDFYASKPGLDVLHHSIDGTHLSTILSSLAHLNNII